MSDPKGDDPFKGDKRTDETVMISSDDLGGMVDAAKAGGQPSAVEQATAAKAATGGPNVAVIVLAVLAVIAVVAIAVVALA